MQKRNSERYNGRKTFVVKTNSTEGNYEYLWIDAEKRVVVRMMGEGYEVILSESPFN